MNIIKACGNFVEDCICDNVRFSKTEFKNKRIRRMIERTPLYPDTLYEAIKKADPETLKYLVEEYYKAKD
jgi:hypothetical protein